MLLGLTCQLIRFLTDLVLVRTRSDAQLRAEVLALRHPLRVLERKVGKPAWQSGDHVLLATLSRLLPRSSSGLRCCRSRRPCSAGTAIWSGASGAGFRHCPPRPRPARDPERRVLVLKLAGENQRW